MQNQAFYRTGIFGNFFLGGGGNFAFSKREFPVALGQSHDFSVERLKPTRYAKPDRPPEARSRCGIVEGGGAASLFPTARKSGECCTLPQLGTGLSPDVKQFSSIFSAQNGFWYKWAELWGLTFSLGWLKPSIAHAWIFDCLIMWWQLNYCRTVH